MFWVMHVCVVSPECVVLQVLSVVRFECVVWYVLSVCESVVALYGTLCVCCCRVWCVVSLLLLCVVRCEYVVWWVVSLGHACLLCDGCVWFFTHWFAVFMASWAYFRPDYPWIIMGCSRTREVRDFLGQSSKGMTASLPVLTLYPLPAP